MSDATEITNIVFSALSDRKGFDDWFDQIDQELQTEIKAEIAEAIAALRAQPDHSELVKDAARYRWLREQHWGDSKFAVVSNPKTAVNLGSICPSRELLDEAIDAAIGETME